MNDELVTLIVTSGITIGVIVSIMGGVVSAAHTYSKERKKIPPIFDWVDFLLLTITGSFSGFIGYLFASWKLDDVFLILGIAGLSAIGGYNMLLTIKDLVIDMLKSRLLAETNKANKDK